MLNLRPALGDAPSSAASFSRLKLVLRVYSAEELAHSSSQGAYCKMYLSESPMLEGSSSGSGRKSFEGSSPPPPPGEDLLQLARRDSAGRDDGDVDGVRVFRTKVAHQQPNKLAPPETIWDEAFEVPMPARSSSDVPAILSVRVKSHHLLYCPVIGACAISLLNLRVGERLEQWFPLHKGKKPAGRLRLTLLLTFDDAKRRPGSGQRLSEGSGNNKGLQADVLAARAANLEADEAIKRLLERRLREDEERRLRKLTRRASRLDDKKKKKKKESGGPLAEVGPPVFETRADQWEDATALVARKLDDVVFRGGVKRPPQPQRPMPPLGAPPAVDNQLKEPKGDDARGSLGAASGASSEYERRVERKLRRLQRERKRLQALKQQLKKYIPDLNVDSDSESDSDSTLSSASDGREGRAAAAEERERPRKSAP